MSRGKYFKFNDMKMTFKTTEDLAEWVYTMHLQNTNGRETENEMFRLGIENCIQELTELNLLDLPNINKAKRPVICPYCESEEIGKQKEYYCCDCGTELDGK